jgi:hypothetical protein
MEEQVQLTQVVEEVEVVTLLLYPQQLEELVEQEVQVLLLLEDQVQQDLVQRQEQTQLQHYRHQLEDVLLRHSRFLEH